MLSYAHGSLAVLVCFSGFPDKAEFENPFSKAVVVILGLETELSPAGKRRDITGTHKARCFQESCDEI